MPTIIELGNLIGAIGGFATFPLIGVIFVVFWLVFKMKPTEKSDRVEFTLSRNQYRLVRILVALAFIAYVADISDRIGLIAWVESRAPITEVYDRTFINERVPLDGFGYHHCTFQNVQFVFNGTAKTYEFSNNTLKGATFTSDNPAILESMEFLSRLGFLQLPVLGPDGSNITPGSGRSQ